MMSLHFIHCPFCDALSKIFLMTNPTHIFCLYCSAQRILQQSEMVVDISKAFPFMRTREQICHLIELEALQRSFNLILMLIYKRLLHDGGIVLLFAVFSWPSTAANALFFKVIFFFHDLCISGISPKKRIDCDIKFVSKKKYLPTL